MRSFLCYQLFLSIFVFLDAFFIDYINLLLIYLHGYYGRVLAVFILITFNQYQHSLSVC